MKRIVVIVIAGLLTAGVSVTTAGALSGEGTEISIGSGCCKQ